MPTMPSCLLLPPPCCVVIAYMTGCCVWPSNLLFWKATFLLGTEGGSLETPYPRFLCAGNWLPVAMGWPVSGCMPDGEAEGSPDPKLGAGLTIGVGVTLTCCSCCFNSSCSMLCFNSLFCSSCCASAARRAEVCCCWDRTGCCCCCCRAA